METRKALELWGGVECTVNRVGDDYYDQLQRSGHYERIEDLNLFAQLGLKALRYPLLWEHHADASSDWSWADARMNRLRELRIEPIVGLVHHGSGPPHTSLLDPEFPRGLAQHARAVAQRYPWVRYWNPVNEPLTTARFSCLYGHWYPHRKDLLCFAKALLIEIEAVKQSMRAIRELNPAAQLVQSEDMGKTYATKLLAYQAEFENERRWLSFDLLCGRLTPEHPIYGYLRWVGVSDDELKPFIDEPLPPDILGINHYVVGERFLDERLDRYPERTHGGNGRQAYADVSAVRVCATGIVGPYGILRETWDRYHRPIAVTEAHLGCTREEQVRWLMEMWNAARTVRREGGDVRAVTVWSLLGAYDWHCLLTRCENLYEPGAFDMRGSGPRATALTKCAQALAAGKEFQHPIVDGDGWWRREIRFTYPPTRPYVAPGKLAVVPQPVTRPRRREPRPILITGATGTLGNGFRRLCDLRGLAHRVVTRQEMDIGDPDSIRRMTETVKPWAVINTAGYVRVDDAERDAERCYRENSLGAANLADACASANIPLVTFSSDLVFDGAKQQPYVESDTVNPLNIYGLSKVRAENEVLKRHANSLVVRTSCFFGPWDDYNFITVTLRRLANREPVPVISDLTMSPTYVPDLVNASLDLLIDGETGIWHLANSGATTWAEFAAKAAELTEHAADLLIPKPLAEFSFAATHPKYGVLGSERGQMLPPWQQALERYVVDRREFEREVIGKPVTDDGRAEPPRPDELAA